MVRYLQRYSANQQVVFADTVCVCFFIKKKERNIKILQSHGTLGIC